MRWFFLTLVLWCGAAQAQPFNVPTPFLTPNRAVTSTLPPVYTAPGDITTFAMWGGFRAYTNAIAAAGTQKLVDLINSSANTCSVLVATAGGMGLTTSCSVGGDNGKTPWAWAGTDTTGTGSISGTTLTFVGGNIGDVVTGGTTAPYTYIISGSSPTWTVNISQTVASATLTLTFPTMVTNIYDQTGNGNNCSPVNTSNRPQLIVPLASLPHMVMRVANLQGVRCLLASLNQPVSYYAVEQRTGDTTTFGFVLGSATLGGLQYLNVANTMFVYAGTTPVQATVSDNTRHLVQSVANGASSLFNVDGVDGSPGNAGSGATGVGNSVGTDTTSGDSLTGDIEEFGWIIGATSSGTRAALHTNGSAYWGTP